MSRLEFRDAVAGDIETITQLAIDGSIIPGRYDGLDLSNPRYRATFDAILADPCHRLVVAIADQMIVGTMQISYLPDLMNGGWRGQIENVHIRASQRGRGFGGEMMRWAIARCRERGCVLVQLTSHKLRADAHRFYTSLGFENSHEGFKLTL